MSIFSENYLMEHGGAHRKVNKTQNRLEKEYLNLYSKYKNLNDNNGDPREIEKVRHDIDNNIKSSIPVDEKSSIYNLRTGKCASNEYFKNDNIEAKRKIGAGKDNIPKNREAGTYSKLQAEKRKNLKEACEYILSILDESEYIDDDYNFEDID